MSKKYFVTTAIDYTNGVIHVGHAYQKIIADALTRYHRLIGDKTFFLTGTDEHGGTSQQAAEKSGKSPKEYVDEISGEDREQLDSLNISYDRFIRTTDEDHKKTVSDFYLKVKANGDIYKGEYTGYYCVGCESYKTLTEIENGKCPLHPTRELEKIKEENYFFRWSKYSDFLKDHISKNSDFILPKSQRENMLGFLKQGLEDIAISRPKSKVSWGIPVPDDSEHTVFVWFDALVNYVSGAPNGFWPADVHILGKDNVRWHALLWPAMLKSAGYELPKTIYGHGFITLNGEKISKSRGNIIRPTDLIKEFGVDPIRYYFLRHGPLIEDVDISLEKIKEVYNSDLANGLGNLVSRVAKLCEKIEIFESPTVNKLVTEVPFNSKNTKTLYARSVEEFRFDETIKLIWDDIRITDQYINEQKPWELNGNNFQSVVQVAVDSIRYIAVKLKPFLPETAEKIEEQFKGPKIKSISPLFPRLK